MNEFFFEGNRSGALPPCGQIVPHGTDDHMARAPYTGDPDKLLSGTAAWLDKIRGVYASGRECPNQRWY